MNRAVRFYARTLGLSVKSEGEDWSELDADGVTIGLNAREATHKGGNGGAVLTFQPRLTEAGVEFVDEVSSHSWGRIASFKDSEGNDLQLFGPPSE
jgi:predicted enzyme related to lactoylglutathione lyase